MRYKSQIKKSPSFCFFLLILITNAFSQERVIPLFSAGSPASKNWQHKENVFKDSNGSGEQYVYNVSEPALIVFSPKHTSLTKTAIVVCPGGAFHVLGIDNEGYDVARWLNTLGITAFILKYRLVQSNTNEPLKELNNKMKKFTELDRENDSVVTMAIADANEAILYVRQHAGEFKIDKDKIGLMGFSAGATVTAGVAFTHSASSRPDFVAPLYGYLGALKNLVVTSDAPPLFAVACSDDPLGFAPHSLRLFQLWTDAKKSGELHIYQAGGHGFGMKQQGLPVDGWTHLFSEWLRQLGFL